jgi:hypothetical protein
MENQKKFSNGESTKIQQWRINKNSAMETSVKTIENAGPKVEWLSKNHKVVDFVYDVALRVRFKTSIKSQRRDTRQCSAKGGDGCTCAAKPSAGEPGTT